MNDVKANELAIDGQRFWSTVMRSAEIGPGVAGGLRRLALTEPDREVRDEFRGWCEAAGLEVTVDALGNMFARREGREPDLPPVLIGSHLDTQIAGGRFDGIVGVLAGLEIARTLNDHGVETRRPIEIVNWSNEEGARFGPPMSASAVFAGLQSLDWGLSRADADGVLFGEALKAIGYDGPAPVGGRDIDSYFELHIEQGPILDAERIPVGVVTGSYATRGFVVKVTGETSHAGPTPMAKRRNALVGAAMVAVGVNDIGWRYAPDGKSTVTRIDNWPNLIGIVPSQASLTVDMRHPDEAVVRKMAAEFEDVLADASKRANVDMRVAESWGYGAERFDADCVGLLRAAAQEIGAPYIDIVSQAGHDAFNLARMAPTAMIFCPCKDGITHNEAEDCADADVFPSVNVLLHAALRRANRA